MAVIESPTDPDSVLVDPSRRSTTENAASQERLKTEPIKDFEDILQAVGGWGRYQVTLLFVFFPFTLFLSYVAYSPILFLYVPDHWCHVDNLTADMASIVFPMEPDGSRSQCLVYDVDYQQMLASGVRDPNGSWPKVGCPNGHEYNFTGHFHSAATDMNWVCEDSWKPAFTQSIFFAGGIIGTLFFGYTADHYGRLWTLLASNSLLLVTGLATPFCQNFIAFAIIRFLMGLTHTTFFSVFFLHTLESVSIEKRSYIGNLSLAISLTVGGTYQPWLLKYIGNWKIWHHMLYIQVLFVLVPPWFVHESFRWLASKGRVEESVLILKAIAKTNGKTVDPFVYQSFERMVRKVKSHQVQRSWKDLFRTPRLRKHTLLMFITWMLIASMFDGHIRNISNLKYSIYWTFTISSAIELPADLLTIWCLNALGRRWSAFFSMALSTVCMTICGLNLDNPLLSTVAAMAGRFFITCAMNTGAQISFEVVPTELRGQGNALANVCAQSAQFFSPIIVYSSKGWDALPFMILGTGALIGAITALYLPETADVDLPDTIEEGEEFGKNRPFFYVPILHRKHNLSPRRPESESEAMLPDTSHSK